PWTSERDSLGSGALPGDERRRRSRLVRGLRGRARRRRGAWVVAMRGVGRGSGAAAEDEEEGGVGGGVDPVASAGAEGEGRAAFHGGGRTFGSAREGHGARQRHDQKRSGGRVLDQASVGT